MGELILCNRTLAAMPYYIEEISLNIFSLEELSYYIENNTSFLTRDFMRPELCEWIEEQAGDADLGKDLLRIVNAGGTMDIFLDCLLQRTGYLSTEEINDIITNVREMARKPEEECAKIRADSYLERKKYVSAIYEYRSLLKNRKVIRNQMFAGKIWHNLGTAYARLMLFDEAKKCYRLAFELDKDSESFEQSVLAEVCAGQECLRREMVVDVAKSHGMEEADARGLQEKFNAVKDGGVTEDFIQNAAEVLEDWKLTYSKCAK